MNTGYKILAATTAASIACLPVFADTKSYDFEGFDEISISAGIEADIVVGPEFSVVAEARDSDTFDKLDIRVRGHTLYIDRDSSLIDFLFGDRNRLSVTVTLPELDEIAASSGVTAVVRGDFGDTFTVDASSGAEITVENLDVVGASLSASSGSEIEVTGRCETLEVNVSSGADVDAKTLECMDVDASASSGAEANVFASESITSSASSGGDVDVWGSPNNTDISNSSGGDTDLKD